MSIGEPAPDPLDDAPDDTVPGAAAPPELLTQPPGVRG